jgi:signal peptidase I
MDRTGGSSSRRRSALRRVTDAAEVLLLTVALALALKVFVLGAVHVHTASMEDTLLAGDFLLVNKFVYGERIPPFIPLVGGGRGPALRSPGRGDVIVFHAPDDTASRLYVKRLVGLPGDTVTIRGGKLFVNGSPVPLPRMAKEPRSALPDFGPVVVPGAGEQRVYFVLGDNRENSLDSRQWGFVPFENIVGQAMLIYWSVDDVTGIRWNRPGTFVR